MSCGVRGESLSRATGVVPWVQPPALRLRLCEASTAAGRGPMQHLNLPMLGTKKGLLCLCRLPRAL